MTAHVHLTDLKSRETSTWTYTLHLELMLHTKPEVCIHAAYDYTKFKNQVDK